MRTFRVCASFDPHPELDRWSDEYKVAATDSEDAAEKVGERSDAGDYDVLQGATLHVAVFDDGTWVQFTVTGESVPTYYAKAVEVE